MEPTLPLPAELADYLCVRDFGWDWNACQHSPIEWKAKMLSLRRIDNRVQASLMRDKEWMRQQEEHADGGSEHPAMRDLGPNAEFRSMDQWSPDFFERLDQGRLPAPLRGDPTSPKLDANATTPDLFRATTIDISELE